jgi:hypothetical protein
MVHVWGLSWLRLIHLPVSSSVAVVHSGHDGWRTGWKSPVNDEATGKEKQDNMEPPVSSVTVYIRCIDAWEQGWAGHTQLQVAAQGE